MEKPRAENIEKNGRSYLTSAEERLKEARILQNEASYAGSISRSYYAFLDAATACLLTKGLIPRSHTGAIELLSLHFIKKGDLDKKYVQWFKKIKKDREEADYKHGKTFTRKEAEETLKQAREFVSEIGRDFPKIGKKKG